MLEEICAAVISAVVMTARPEEHNRPSTLRLRDLGEVLGTNDRRRAFVLRSSNRLLGRGGVTPGTGQWHAEQQDCFSTNITSSEIRLTPEAGIDDVQIEPRPVVPVAPDSQRPRNCR